MQPWSLWFVFFMMLVIIPSIRARKQQQIRLSKRNKLKRKKGGNVMNELIKSYIGKEIIVWTNWSSGVSGTATRIEENWLEIQDKKGNLKLLNTDYISRIQEYPKNKNGKKKAIVM